MSTNDILLSLDKPDISNGIVEGYSEYLAQCISEIKFIDMSNLREYLKAHLNIFFSEAINDIELGGYTKRIDDLKKENEQLAINRAEMEEELNIAKAKLRQRKHVDIEWMARCTYAYKMKGIRIQTNCREIGRLGVLVSNNRFKLHNEKTDTEQGLFLLYAKEKLGKEEYKKWWAEVKEINGLNG